MITKGNLANGPVIMSGGRAFQLTRAQFALWERAEKAGWYLPNAELSAEDIKILEELQEMGLARRA